MIPTGFALSITQAEAIVCPASAGPGVYGTPQPVRLERGLYLVLASDEAGVRETNQATMRTDGAGTRLEVPVRPDTPLPILLTSDTAFVAAKDGACVVWFVPLLPVTEEARAFVERACAR